MVPTLHDDYCERRNDPGSMPVYVCHCAERAYAAFIDAGGDRHDPCWRDHFGGAA